MPAAPKIVRIDRAVRPCFPMTFPRSPCATRSSRTVTCWPSTARTSTSSGLSTRAFAICSINSFTCASRVGAVHPGPYHCSASLEYALGNASLAVPRAFKLLHLLYQTDLLQSSARDALCSADHNEAATVRDISRLTVGDGWAPLRIQYWIRS